MNESGLTVGIAIPAYRNVDRLRRCLASIKAIDPGWLSQTVVVDDSGDGAVCTALKQEFSIERWIVHEENKGFVASANHAVLSSASPLVLLLNDDVELVSDSRNKIVETFGNEKLFALSLRSINEDGVTREGPKRLVWRCGIAKVLHTQTSGVADSSPILQTAYAVGGHSVFRKSMFADLRGFDDLFHPFYWEDVDLSERARQQGWDVCYLSESAVLHRTEGAIRSSSSSEAIRRITWRNRFIFSIRHAQDMNRSLLPLGLAWYRVKATLSSDRVVGLALVEAVAMSKKHSLG